MTILFIELPGIWELLIIFFVIIIFMGNKTPGFARNLGKYYIQTRRFFDKLYEKYFFPLEIELDEAENDKNNKIIENNINEEDNEKEKTNN